MAISSVLKTENLRALSCSEAESEIRKVWMKTRCTGSTVELRKSCCSHRDIVNVSKSSADHLWPYQCRWRRIATATIKNTTRKWWEMKAYGDGTFLRCNLDGYVIHVATRIKERYIALRRKWDFYSPVRRKNEEIEMNSKESENINFEFEELRLSRTALRIVYNVKTLSTIVLFPRNVPLISRRTIQRGEIF